MDIEQNPSLVARARVHAALGEPARLAIVDHLALGDASPGEIGQKLGLPTNLLAHHMKILDQAGLIRRRQSEGDRRRSYLQLVPGALTGLLPAPLRLAPRVVFVCTHNSARSQLAAALWAGKGSVPAVSAGTSPAARVHPHAVAIARRHGLSLAVARPRHLDEVLRPDDLVVAVCDNAHEDLADQRGGGDRLHWSVPDPVAAGTDTAFEHAYADIAGRIDRLAPAVHLPKE
ncbi:arsenate reductase/protein-tyrosine-phosphatase family protein [Nonomuraea sp. 3N208]|uniref:arsenate reductase/protein-tyrosine-phosphatase family protein n=1 Tax=Nonomuraea sp. 3N208 TaxID=3457421 RepID=UPI003FD49095